MQSSLLERISAINAKIRGLLFRSREALAGRSTFGAEEVRALAEPIHEMAPIAHQAKHLRTVQPDLAGELDAYAENLGELQRTLEQVRFMLIARRANLAATRSQIEAVAQWANAFQKTR